MSQSTDDERDDLGDDAAMSTGLTRQDELQLLIDNDTRNVEAMPELSDLARLRCIATCAQRYLDAKELWFQHGGSPAYSAYVDAEANLRASLKWRPL